MSPDITQHLHALAALSSGLNEGGAGRSRDPSDLFFLVVALADLICSKRSSPNLTRFFSAVATFGSLTFFSYRGGREEEREGGEGGRRGREEREGGEGGGRGRGEREGVEGGRRGREEREGGEGGGRGRGGEGGEERGRGEGREGGTEGRGGEGGVDGNEGGTKGG